MKPTPVRTPRRSRFWVAGTLAAVALLGAAALQAQNPLQKALVDEEVAAHWIYDDFARAKAEAASTGKPILALFRCVP